MKKALYIFTSLFFLLSCNEVQQKDKKKSEYEKKQEIFSEKLKLNKKKYIIQKGEQVKIYFTFNSCCQFCSPRLEKLKNSKFLFNKQETFSNGCLGCTDLYSLNFKGISKGIDTIYTNTIFPNDKCDTIKNLKNFDKYLIIVK